MTSGASFRPNCVHGAQLFRPRQGRDDSFGELDFFHVFRVHFEIEFRPDRVGQVFPRVVYVDVHVGPVYGG